MGDTVSIAFNDPAWDLPALNYLQPTYPWRETFDDASGNTEVVVVVVVARALPGNHRAVVRGEIIASPAYVTCCHGGRMIAKDALGGFLVELALGGHGVTVERREVRAALHDIITLNNNAEDDWEDDWEHA